MFKKIIKTIFLLVLISLLGWFTFGGQAKEGSLENLSEVCQLDNIEQECEKLSSKECRELLEKCATYWEEKSIQIEKELNRTEQKKNTLQNRISLIQKKIKNLNYRMYQNNLVIKDLRTQIEDTQSSIEHTTQKVKDSKEKLAEIIREIYEQDQKSTVEILLSEQKLSGFFSNLAALEVLENENRQALQSLKKLESQLKEQKEALHSEKTGLEKTVQIQSLQKQENVQTREEKEYLLQLTKEEYQKYLEEKEETEQKAAEIRARIYELIGVRKEVTYKEALEIAEYVSSQTGIKPALLLGVLSQESAIGRNVGQCYLRNENTGSGVVAYNGKKVEKVMNPSRDIPPFKDIIADINQKKGLDLDPFETLVSCPMSIGWGGAMGPAQFIPSTWVLFEDKIKSKTGGSADPWDIRDASYAAAIYLKENINRYGSEGAAVQAYFCGSPTNSYWCSRYQKNVLYLTECHQNFIDTNSMSSGCQQDIGLR